MEVYSGYFGVVAHPEGHSIDQHQIVISGVTKRGRKDDLNYSKSDPLVIWHDAAGISEVEYQIDELIRQLQELKKKARKAAERERKKRIAAAKD